MSTSTSLVPAPGDMDTQTLGAMLVKSGYFADARDAAQAIVKVLAGRELGFGPIASMTGIYIVKGRISLSANLIAAAVKRSGRYTFRVRELTDDTCRLEFLEGGESLGESKFTKQDAARAGTQNMDKYPRNMLFARAMSNGAKWFCPDIFGGPIYTPDELGATVDGETGEVIDMPAARVEPPAVTSPAEPPAPAPEPPAVKPAEPPAVRPAADVARRAGYAKLMGQAGPALRAWAETFVQEHAQYRVPGNHAPDMGHLQRSAFAEGFEMVTMDNLAEVERKLTQRALHNEFEKAEAARAQA